MFSNLLLMFKFVLLASTLEGIIPAESTIEPEVAPTTDYPTTRLEHSMDISSTADIDDKTTSSSVSLSSEKSTAGKLSVETTTPKLLAEYRCDKKLTNGRCLQVHLFNRHTTYPEAAAYCGAGSVATITDKTIQKAITEATESAIIIKLTHRVDPFRIYVGGEYLTANNATEIVSPGYYWKIGNKHEPVKDFVWEEGQPKKLEIESNSARVHLAFNWYISRVAQVARLYTVKCNENSCDDVPKYGTRGIVCVNPIVKEKIDLPPRIGERMKKCEENQIHFRSNCLQTHLFDEATSFSKATEFCGVGNPVMITDKETQQAVGNAAEHVLISKKTYRVDPFRIFVGGQYLVKNNSSGIETSGYYWNYGTALVSVGEFVWENGQPKDEIIENNSTRVHLAFNWYISKVAQVVHLHTIKCTKNNCDKDMRGIVCIHPKT